MHLIVKTASLAHLALHSSLNTQWRAKYVLGVKGILSGIRSGVLLVHSRAHPAGAAWAWPCKMVKFMKKHGHTKFVIKAWPYDIYDKSSHAEYWAGTEMIGLWKF